MTKEDSMIGKLQQFIQNFKKILEQKYIRMYTSLLPLLGSKIQCIPLPKFFFSEKNYWPENFPIDYEKSNNVLNNQGKPRYTIQTSTKHYNSFLHKLI